MNSGNRLWCKLPTVFLTAQSCSDFWNAYPCSPKETHTKIKKSKRETNHIERLNNTIRQRWSRLVRKTLSFSKKE